MFMFVDELHFTQSTLTTSFILKEKHQQVFTEVTPVYSTCSLIRIHQCSPDVFASSQDPTGFCICFQLLETIVGGLQALKTRQMGMLTRSKTRLLKEQTWGDVSCTLAPSCCLSPLLCQIRPSLCFLERPRRTLKSADFQSLKTEAKTKQSQHRASDWVSEWLSEWVREIERVSSTKPGKKKAQQTAAHTNTHLHTHTHTMESSLARSAADGKQLSESPGSQS